MDWLGRRVLPVISGDATKLYLISVWGDVEPKVHGPFDTDAKRLAAAKRLAKDHDMGAIFRLDTSSRGVPEVEAFSGDELERNP